MSVAIIINPISGGASPAAARARAQIARTVVDAHGDPVEVCVTERPGHARELARAAVKRGVRLVLAWGGDGTINEIASALVSSSNVALGIVPAGSGNGLARELGVSLRPERAIADALAAEPRLIDVGELGGHLFFNVAGIGLDAYVAWRFSRHHRRGLAGYLTMTAQALLTYTPKQYRITHGKETCDARAILVTIANSAQFGNGARIAPKARLDDGLLDLVVLEERYRLATLCQLPRLFNGTVERIRGCTVRQVQRVTVESDEPMLFHVDGEPMEGGRELRARVYPAALRVAVR